MKKSSLVSLENIKSIFCFLGLSLIVVGIFHLMNCAINYGFSNDYGNFNYLIIANFIGGGASIMFIATSTIDRMLNFDKNFISQEMPTG